MIRYDLEDQEIQEIREIYEKKMALENLAKIISPEDRPDMYNRIVADLGKTMHEYDDWWNAIFVKYSVAKGNYNVDFVNNQIVYMDRADPC